MRNDLAFRMCSFTAWPRCVVLRSPASFSASFGSTSPGGDGGSTNGGRAAAESAAAAAAAASASASAASASSPAGRAGDGCAGDFFTTEICTLLTPTPTRRAAPCTDGSSSDAPSAAARGPAGGRPTLGPSASSPSPSW